MGSAWSKSSDARPVVLPAAVDVDMGAAPYDLSNLKTPVLSGWRLALFVKFAVKTFVWKLISPGMFRKSGITKPLREVVLPERPCYEPVLLPAKPDPAPVLPVSCTLSPAERAQQAAEICCPAADQDPTAATTATTTSSRRLRSRPRIRDFHDAYASGRTTPARVMADTLEMVRSSEAMTPPMRFFIALDEDDVMRQAEASAQRWAAGRPLSVLDGVPMAVKDDTDQLPYPTTSGTTFMPKLREVTRDAQHVEALRAAGAVLLGKANMHEIGQGVTGWNSHFGPARNPANPDHFTGGSSSGSAALVAAGLCPACIGADGGGSIRIPSAFCGVFGLMPTYGRTKEDHKGPSITNTLGVTGPIAGSTEDLAIIYAVMSNLGTGGTAGSAVACRPGYVLPPPSVLLPARWPAATAACSLSGLKVGIYDAWFDDAEPSLVKQCRQAVGLLQEMGAQIVPIVVPELESMRVAHNCIICTEMHHSYYMLSHSYPRLFDEFGYDIQISQKTSSAFSASDLYQSQKYRTRATVFFNRIFEKVDVLVTPSTGISAPRIHSGFGKAGESNLPQLSQIMKFIVTANLIGCPAMSVPVGRDKDNLPVGLQLMGKPWSEATLLDCAHKLEVVLGQDVAQAEPAIALGVLASSSVASSASSSEKSSNGALRAPAASPYLKMAG